MNPWLDWLKNLLKGARPVLELMLKLLALLRLVIWLVVEGLKLLRFWA